MRRFGFYEWLFGTFEKRAPVLLNKHEFVFSFTVLFYKEISHRPSRWKIPGIHSRFAYLLKFYLNLIHSFYMYVVHHKYSWLTVIFNSKSPQGNSSALSSMEVFPISKESSILLHHILLLGSGI